MGAPGLIGQGEQFFELVDHQEHAVPLFLLVARDQVALGKEMQAAVVASEVVHQHRGRLHRLDIPRQAQRQCLKWLRRGREDMHWPVLAPRWRLNVIGQRLTLLEGGNNAGAYQGRLAAAGSTDDAQHFAWRYGQVKSLQGNDFQIGDLVDLD